MASPMAKTALAVQQFPVRSWRKPLWSPVFSFFSPAAGALGRAPVRPVTLWQVAAALNQVWKAA